MPNFFTRLFSSKKKEQPPPGPVNTRASQPASPTQGGVQIGSHRAQQPQQSRGGVRIGGHREQPQTQDAPQQTQDAPQQAESTSPDELMRFDGPVTGQGPKRTQLHAYVLNMIKKYKAHKLVPLVTHAKGLPEDEPAETGQSFIDKGVKFGKKLKGGLDKGLEKVGLEGADEAVTDNGKELFESTGDMHSALMGKDSPAAFGVTNSITSALSTIKSIFSTFNLMRKHLKGTKKASASEIADSFIGSIKGSCDTVIKIITAVGKYAKVMPIIGAIFGAVGAILEGIQHIAATVRASKSFSTLLGTNRRQKEGLKRRYKGKREYIDQKDGKDHVNRFKVAERRAELKPLVDKNERDPDSLTDDEKAEMPEVQAEYDELSDLLLTREIKRADMHRAQRGGLDITMDIISLAGALASLDPTIGTAVSAGLGAGTALFKAGHKAVLFGRQKYRDRQGKKAGADARTLEKTTKGKADRRADLGAHMLQRIIQLDTHGIGDLKETEETAENRINMLNAARAYEAVDDQLSGINIYYSVLMRRKSKTALKSTLATGLSREGATERGLVGSFRSQ